MKSVSLSSLLASLLDEWEGINNDLMSCAREVFALYPRQLEFIEADDETIQSSKASLSCSHDMMTSMRRSRHCGGDGANADDDDEDEEGCSSSRTLGVPPSVLMPSLTRRILSIYARVYRVVSLAFDSVSAPTTCDKEALLSSSNGEGCHRAMCVHGATHTELLAHLIVVAFRAWLRLICDTDSGRVELPASAFSLTMSFAHRDVASHHANDVCPLHAMHPRSVSPHGSCETNKKTAECAGVAADRPPRRELPDGCGHRYRYAVASPTEPNSSSSSDNSCYCSTSSLTYSHVMWGTNHGHNSLPMGWNSRAMQARESWKEKSYSDTLNSLLDEDDSGLVCGEDELEEMWASALRRTRWLWQHEVLQPLQRTCVHGNASCDDCTGGRGRTNSISHATDEESSCRRRKAGASNMSNNSIDDSNTGRNGGSRDETETCSLRTPESTTYVEWHGHAGGVQHITHVCSCLDRNSPSCTGAQTESNCEVVRHTTCIRPHDNAATSCCHCHSSPSFSLASSGGRASLSRAHHERRCLHTYSSLALHYQIMHYVATYALRPLELAHVVHPRDVVMRLVCEVLRSNGSELLRVLKLAAAVMIAQPGEDDTEELLALGQSERSAEAGVGSPPCGESNDAQDIDDEAHNACAEQHTPNRLCDSRNRTHGTSEEHTCNKSSTDEARCHGIMGSEVDECTRHLHRALVCTPTNHTCKEDCVCARRSVSCAAGTRFTQHEVRWVREVDLPMLHRIHVMLCSCGLRELRTSLVASVMQCCCERGQYVGRSTLGHLCSMATALPAQHSDDALLAASSSKCVSSLPKAPHSAADTVVYTSSSSLPDPVSCAAAAAAAAVMCTAGQDSQDHASHHKPNHDTDSKLIVPSDLSQSVDPALLSGSSAMHTPNTTAANVRAGAASEMTATPRATTAVLTSSSLIAVNTALRDVVQQYARIRATLMLYNAGNRHFMSTMTASTRADLARELRAFLHGISMHDVLAEFVSLWGVPLWLQLCTHTCCHMSQGETTKQSQQHPQRRSRAESARTTSASAGQSPVLLHRATPSSLSLLDCLFPRHVQDALRGCGALLATTSLTESVTQVGAEGAAAAAGGGGSVKRTSRSVMEGEVKFARSSAPRASTLQNWYHGNVRRVKYGAADSAVTNRSRQSQTNRTHRSQRTTQRKGRRRGSGAAHSVCTSATATEAMSHYRGGSSAWRSVCEVDTRVVLCNERLGQGSSNHATATLNSNRNTYSRNAMATSRRRWFIRRQQRQRGRCMVTRPMPYSVTLAHAHSPSYRNSRSHHHYRNHDGDDHGGHASENSEDERGAVDGKGGWEATSSASEVSSAMDRLHSHEVSRLSHNGFTALLCLVPGKPAHVRDEIFRRMANGVHAHLDSLWLSYHEPPQEQTQQLQQEHAPETLSNRAMLHRSPARRAMESCLVALQLTRATFASELAAIAAMCGTRRRDEVSQGRTHNPTPNSTSALTGNSTTAGTTADNNAHSNSNNDTSSHPSDEEKEEAEEDDLMTMMARMMGLEYNMNASDDDEDDDVGSAHVHTAHSNTNAGHRGPGGGWGRGYTTAVEDAVMAVERGVVQFVRARDSQIIPALATLLRARIRWHLYASQTESTQHLTGFRTGDAQNGESNARSTTASSNSKGTKERFVEGQEEWGIFDTLAGWGSGGAHESAQCATLTRTANANVHRRTRNTSGAEEATSSTAAGQKITPENDAVLSLLLDFAALVPSRERLITHLRSLLSLDWMALPLLLYPSLMSYEAAPPPCVVKSSASCLSTTAVTVMLKMMARVLRCVALRLGTAAVDVCVAMLRDLQVGFCDGRGRLPSSAPASSASCNAREAAAMNIPAALAVRSIPQGARSDGCALYRHVPHVRQSYPRILGSLRVLCSAWWSMRNNAEDRAALGMVHLKDMKTLHTTTRRSTASEEAVSSTSATGWWSDVLLDAMQWVEWYYTKHAVPYVPFGYREVHDCDTFGSTTATCCLSKHCDMLHNTNLTHSMNGTTITRDKSDSVDDAVDGAMRRSRTAPLQASTTLGTQLDARTRQGSTDSLAAETHNNSRASRSHLRVSLSALSVSTSSVMHSVSSAFSHAVQQRGNRLVDNIRTTERRSGQFGNDDYESDSDDSNDHNSTTTTNTTASTTTHLERSSFRSSATHSTYNNQVSYNHHHHEVRDSRHNETHTGAPLTQTTRAFLSAAAAALVSSARVSTPALSYTRPPRYLSLSSSAASLTGESQKRSAPPTTQQIIEAARERRHLCWPLCLGSLTFCVHARCGRDGSNCDVDGGVVCSAAARTETTEDGAGNCVSGVKMGDVLGAQKNFIQVTGPPVTLLVLQLIDRCDCVPQKPSSSSDKNSQSHTDEYGSDNKSNGQFDASRDCATRDDNATHCSMTSNVSPKTASKDMRRAAAVACTLAFIHDHLPIRLPLRVLASLLRGLLDAGVVARQPNHRLRQHEYYLPHTFPRSAAVTVSITRALLPLPPSNSLLSQLTTAAAVPCKDRMNAQNGPDAMNATHDTTSCVATSHDDAICSSMQRNFVGDRTCTTSEWARQTFPNEPPVCASMQPAATGAVSLSMVSEGSVSVNTPRGFPVATPPDRRGEYGENTDLNMTDEEKGSESAAWQEQWVLSAGDLAQDHAAAEWRRVRRCVETGVVRLMKANSVMAHETLYTAVTNALDELTVAPAMFKGCVEQLMDRGFMERDSAGDYRYIA